MTEKGNGGERRTYRRSAIPIETRREAFLKYVERGMPIIRACKAAQISTAHIYKFKEANTDFKMQLEAAEKVGGLVMEEEAWRRAIEGNQEPQFYKGQVCGYITKQSDTMLIFLMKGRFPEKYADRKHLLHDTKVPMEFNIGIEREDDENKLHADPDAEEAPRFKQ